MIRETVCAIIPVLLVTSLFFALNIHTAKSQGVAVYIRADGSIDPPDAPMTTSDNVTYTLTGNLTIPSDIAIVVERDDIVVDGANYTIFGFGEFFYPSIGIDISGRSNVTIVNTRIRDFLRGIRLFSSVNNSITKNRFGGNPPFGDIECVKSMNNSIFGNQISSYGMWLNDSDYNRIYENSGGIIWLTDSSDHNIFFENSNGIYLDSSSYNVISRNNIVGSGISLDTYSNHNNITGNSLAGMGLTFSSFNSISGNTIANGSIIRLEYSHNNSISKNRITASAGGIAFIGCANNSAVENIIENNNGSGISVWNSIFNYVVGNNISGNKIGFSMLQSGDNTIYHNNFTGNALQVQWYTAPGLNLGNNWDNGYPSGGNYWSDYNGTDYFSGPYQNLTGSDGIGDTPYVINAINTDHYPIIPELPTLLTTLFSMTLILTATILYKRRRRMSFS